MRIRRTTINRDGYSIVLLSKKGRLRHHFVHRLMAEAFLPNPHGKPEVNHIRGKRCVIWNIEWATKTENESHAANNGLKSHGSRHYRARLNEVLVAVLRRRYEKGGISQQQLADEVGISQPSMSSLLRYQSWRHVP